MQLNSRESEEGMERLIEIKTHVTGFCYADKKEGVFAQDVFDKLAAYEDTGLMPKQIEDIKKGLKQYDEDRIAAQQECGSVCEDAIEANKQIQAQQQEIDELKDQNDSLYDTVNMLAPYIIGKKEAEVVEDLKELLTLKQQITALIADKDEQAERIMRYDTVLRQAHKALSHAEIKFCYLANKKNYLECKEAIEAIVGVTSDALLGGAEDEQLL